jgi:hypothetical protein
MSGIKLDLLVREEEEDFDSGDVSASFWMERADWAHIVCASAFISPTDPPVRAISLFLNGIGS